MRWQGMWRHVGTEHQRSCWTGCTTTRMVSCSDTADIQEVNSLKTAWLKLFGFCSSWYLVCGLYHGRTAERKSLVPRHWLYPLSSWHETSFYFAGISHHLSEARRSLTDLHYNPCSFKTQALLLRGMNSSNDKRLNYLEFSIQSRRTKLNLIILSDLWVLGNLHCLKKKLSSEFVSICYKDSGCAV